MELLKYVCREDDEERSRQNVEWIERDRERAK